MAVKYGKFEIPSKITGEELSSRPNFVKFVAEPFERGFGHTVGNSLRRMMMNSLEAPAVISLRMEGVPHEYMAVEGIVEDISTIVLNLKGALLRKLPSSDEAHSRDTRIVTAVVDITQEDLNQNNRQVLVCLGDIVKDGSFDVVNPDLVLFTVTKPLRKQVDLRVAIGRGYVSSERHSKEDRLTNEILIDAIFSPVRLVNYYVEDTRVGQDTDYDRLILEVQTDGRVTPQEALNFAAQIGARHLDIFNKIAAPELSFDSAETEVDDSHADIMDKLALRINEIELSVRSTNCLAGASIETIAELVIKPESEMLKFRNFGKKSLNEIKAKLHEMGLGLGMDLQKYGVTKDNVKQVITQYVEERSAKKEGAPSYFVNGR